MPQWLIIALTGLAIDSTPDCKDQFAPDSQRPDNHNHNNPSCRCKYFGSSSSGALKEEEEEGLEAGALHDEVEELMQAPNNFSDGEERYGWENHRKWLLGKPEAKRWMERKEKESDICYLYTSKIRPAG